MVIDTRRLQMVIMFFVIFDGEDMLLNFSLSPKKRSKATGLWTFNEAV